MFSSDDAPMDDRQLDALIEAAASCADDTELDELVTDLAALPLPQVRGAIARAVERAPGRKSDYLELRSRVELKRLEGVEDVDEILAGDSELGELAFFLDLIALQRGYPTFRMYLAAQPESHRDYGRAIRQTETTALARRAFELGDDTAVALLALRGDEGHEAARAFIARAPASALRRVREIEQNLAEETEQPVLARFAGVLRRALARRDG